MCEEVVFVVESLVLLVEEEDFCLDGFSKNMFLRICALEKLVVSFEMLAERLKQMFFVGVAAWIFLCRNIDVYDLFTWLEDLFTHDVL